VQDPLVPTRYYAATDAVDYAHFWFGNPVKKSLAFEFSLIGAAGRELKTIYFAEASTLSGTARLVEWRADLNLNFVPAANNFIFIPPANARILVGPRPGIG
jgi:hypothetical protein